MGQGHTAKLAVERIGGITETEVSFRPGVTVLVGRNATNRTSLLQAIMAACGSTDVSVRGDADEGRVALELGETYERTLQSGGGTVAASGRALLSEPRSVELFAFLLGSNPVRQAVVRGDVLRDLIMEPIDTDAIEAEIARLQTERADIEADLEEIDRAETQLATLQERLETLDEEIATTEADLADARERLAVAGGRIDEERAHDSELETRLEELNETRRELAEVRSDIDIEESAIEEVRTEIESLEAERDTLPDAPAETIEELDRQIEFVREQKRDAEASVNDLQRIIQFNEEMLDGANIDLLEEEVSEEGSVTDRLLEDAQVVCWTCGSEVLAGAVESTLDRLRRVRQDELAKANRLDDRLADLEAERERFESSRQREATIERKLQSLREELAESRDRVERFEEHAAELTEEVATIERDVERLQERSQDELLEIQERVNELEFELADLREERSEVSAELERTETRVEKRADLEAQREAIQETIVEHRTRIERTEEEAVEQFNAQMADLLELLEYGNVERIWLEPREAGDGDPGRTFELHVVRTTDEGVAYEDTLDHLSESEREVTAIVFALAGYLAHDVYDEVPFLLLDSLEAIDATRIRTLLEYVSDYATFVVVALLPEDARTLPEEYDRVTEI